MNTFETKLTTILKQYGRNYDMLCQRNIQSRFVTQYADILIDCGTTKKYIAIECKRVQTNNFYFKRYFHETQLQTLFDYFIRTGRSGFVSIKLKKTISIIPWSAVLMMHLLGFSEIPMSVIEANILTQTKFIDIIHGVDYLSNCECLY